MDIFVPRLPPASPAPRPMVAIYWDFENVHAALVDEREGERTYTLIRNQRQEKRVDVKALMDYVAALGDVAINRAYANWQNFSAYRYDLMEYSVDLIQLYSRGMHGKNGADIRIVLDAMEDVQQFPHVTHVVILSGDSDYIGLAQKLRQAGKTVIGIGVQATTNAFWQKACNQFKYYQTLLAQSKATPDPDLPPGRSLGDAKALLAQAVRQLSERHDREWVTAAMLRPMMARLDPTFDEGNYGMRSFSAFLGACPDVVRVERGDADYLVALVEQPAVPAPAANGTSAPPPASSEPPAEEPPRPPATAGERYVEALRRLGIELPPPGSLRPILAAIAQAFRNGGGKLGGWWLVDEGAAAVLAERGLPVDVREVRKARFVAFRARMFKLFGPGAGIGWRSEVDEDLMLRSVEHFLIKTIADYVEEETIDLGALRSLLHGEGEEGREADLERLTGLARSLDERMLVAPPPAEPATVTLPAGPERTAAPVFRAEPRPVPLVPEVYDPAGELMRRRLAQIAAETAPVNEPAPPPPDPEPAAEPNPPPGSATEPVPETTPDPAPERES